MNLQVYSELVFNLFKNAWDQGRSLNFLTTSEKRSVRAIHELPLHFVLQAKSKLNCR